MHTIGRPARGAFAILSSALLLTSCATATPSSSPGASASPAAGSPSAPPSAGSPSTPPSSAPSAAPTVTPAPTATPGPLGVAWHRSPVVAAPSDSWGAWAGVGLHVRWTKLGSTYVFPVDTQDESDGPSGGPQIWLSEDLLHWRRASIPQGPNQHYSVTAVTPGGPGLVAIGRDVPDDSPIEMLWASADGTNWKPVGETGTGLTAGQLWLLRATGAGDVTYAEGMVDVTRFGGAAMDPDSASRILEDGGDLTVFTDQAITNGKVEVWQGAGTSAWRKIATLPKSTGAFIFDAIHGPHGYLVLGCDKDCGGTLAWTSTDGITWQSSKQPTFDNINSVVADQSGFIVVGQRVTGQGCAVAESEIFGETWTSTDGRAWRKMKDQPQFNHAAIYLLIAKQRSLYGVGMRWLSDHSVPTVWSATLPDDSVASGTSTPPPVSGGSTGCGE